MNVLILGAGEIGFFLAEQLSTQRHNISVIESDPDVAESVNEKLDVRVIEGDGATTTILEDAEVSNCDVFLALSSFDHTNLVAASIAKPLGAKKSIARVHNAVQKDQWIFDFRKHFGIDYLFSSERLAAVELAKHIRNPDCLIVEEVARGRIEIQQIVATAGSPAIGRPIRSLGLPARVRIGSIQRAGNALIPGGSESVQPGDVVTLFGRPRSLEQVAPQFRAAVAESSKVVIFGGGDYGLALAQMLDGKRFQTRIIEKDARRCDYLASVLERTAVIHGDATSVRQLKEEQVGAADFFVAATPHDEDNVMTCLQARDLGVKKCVTLIHRADYADAITRAGEKLGIIGAVSPRVATSRELIRFVTDDAFTVLARLRGGIALIEFQVRKAGLIENQRVRDVSWPEGCGLVSITHGSGAAVAVGDDILTEDDTVVAMVMEEKVGAIRALITG